MSEFTLVVFDLDGTLINSRRDLADAANEVLGQCGCDALPEAAIGRLVGDGAATLVTRVFAAAGCRQPPDALERFLTLYNSRLLRFTRVYDGVLDTLRAMQGKTELAVLTNKPLAATRVILDGLELSPYFRHDLVVGGDGRFARKPSPEGLEHLVEKTHTTAAEALMVGDSVIDWRTARAAGTRACVARYGFGFEGFPLADLQPEDRVLERPTDLLSVL